jgi:GNAT superfamily N-acetyltransferase
MPVRHIDPEDKREPRRFVALEHELFGSEPLFVPEIASDVEKRLRGRSLRSTRLSRPARGLRLLPDVPIRGVRRQLLRRALPHRVARGPRGRPPRRPPAGQEALGRGRRAAALGLQRDRPHGILFAEWTGRRRGGFWWGKRYRRAGLIAIGVRDAHPGKHIGQALAATLYRRYEDLGLPTTWPRGASPKSFGGRGRVLYHAYDKPLG